MIKFVIVFLLYLSSSSLSLSRQSSLNHYKHYLQVPSISSSSSILIPSSSTSLLSTLSSTSTYLSSKNETISLILSTSSQPVDYLLLEYLKSKVQDGRKPSFRVCVRALVAVLQTEEKTKQGHGYNNAKQLVLSTKTNISIETYSLLQCALLSSLIQIEDYDNACNHLYIILNDKQIRYPIDVNIISNLFKILLLQYSNDNNIKTKAEMVKKLYKLLLLSDILKYTSCSIHEYGAKAYMILGDVYNAVMSIERIKIRSYLINKDVMELSNIVLNQLSSLSSSNANDDNLMNTLRFALFQPLGLLPVESQLLKSCLSILASSSEHHDIVLRYCKNLQAKGVPVDDDIIESLLFITFDNGGSVQDILDIVKISKPEDYKNKYIKSAITTIAETANLVRDGLLPDIAVASSDSEMVQKIGFIKKFAANIVNLPIVVVDSINRLPNETLNNRIRMMTSINMSLRLLVRVLNKVGLSKEGWEILRTIFEYSEGRWIPDLKIIMITLGDAKRSNISFVKAIIQSGNLPENFVLVAFLAAQNNNDIDRDEGLQLWNTMIKKKFSNCLNSAVIRAAMELGFSVNYETGLSVCNDIIDLSFEIYGHYLRSELTRVLANVFLSLQYISDDISKAPFDIVQHLLHLIDNTIIRKEVEENSSSVTKELVSSIINIDSLLVGGHISLKKADGNRSLLSTDWHDNTSIRKSELLDFSKLYKYLETCRLLRSDTLYLISSVGTDWLNVILKCYLKAGQPLPAIEAVDRVIERIGVNNVESLARLFTPELLATTIFLSSSISYDNTTLGFQKCKKYYDIALSINKNRPTNSLSLALLVAANNFNDVDGAFEIMKDKLAVKGVKVTARKVRTLSKNALRNGKQVELAMFWDEMHRLYPSLSSQSVPSTELLSSLLVYKNSSSLLSWAKIISDSGAALSPNQLKYFLERYNATMHANCLLELLPILSDLSNRYLEPGMSNSMSLKIEQQQMISLPLSMTFLTNMVISLLHQNRERDALQLLQCIHPLQWPYDDILSYLASNNKILDVLAVLQKLQEVNYMTLKESTARTILSLRNDVSISIEDLNSYKDRSQFFHITIEVDKSLVSKIREIIAKIMTSKFNDDNSVNNSKKVEVEMKEFDSDYDYTSPSKMLGMLHDKETSDLDTILSLLPDDNIGVLHDDDRITESTIDDNIQENLMFLLADRENQQLQYDSSMFERTTIIDDTMANFDDILLRNKNNNNNVDKPVSKWVDPESPENIMKFIDDVTSLGRQKDQYYREVNIKGGLISGGNLHVTRQKQYWKNHLRNNMRINNAEESQLDVDEVIIKELAKSILITAKKEFLSDYSSPSSSLSFFEEEEEEDDLFLPLPSSVTNSAVLELFNKRGARFFNDHRHLAKEVTEELLKLAEKTSDLDLSSKLIESLVTNEQFELLNASMESVGLLVKNGIQQRRIRKVSNIFEFILPMLVSWLKDICADSKVSANANKDVRFSLLLDGIIASVISRKPNAATNAVDVISMMIDMNHTIDRKVSELLAALVEANDVDHSLELLNIMLKINVHASNETYEKLITNLLRRQQVDLSCSIIKYLHSKSYLIELDLYIELINQLLIGRNNNDEALLIIKDVKRLSPTSSLAPKTLSDLLLNSKI